MSYEQWAMSNILLNAHNSKLTAQSQIKYGKTRVNTKDSKHPCSG